MHFFHKKPFFRAMIQILLKVYLPIKERISARYFKKNSKKCLFMLQSILSEYSGIELFFVMYGTLLGIYRDNKLIRGDMDIDIGIFLKGGIIDISSFRKYMRKNKVELRHSFEVDQLGVIQDTFILKGVRIDVAYLRHDNNCDISYLTYDDRNELNKVLLFPFHKIEKTRNYNFEDNMVRIPYDPEQYLEDTYGSNWRTPDPNYVYWENPNSMKTEFRGKTIFYNKKGDIKRTL